MVMVIISLVLIHTISLASAQGDFRAFSCGTNGNYTRNSSYETNLDKALSSVSSATTITSGFYNVSIAQNSNDQVNIIGLCRGDIEPNICHGCINNSISKLRELCPNQKDAVGWYDVCMLRYSNRSILYNLETQPAFSVSNPVNVANETQFNEGVRLLLDGLKGRTIGGDSLHKFATGNITLPNLSEIYAALQCTPDLTRLQCSNCLDEAIAQVPNKRQGVTILQPSCSIRFESAPFYKLTRFDGLPPPPPQQLPPPPPSLLPPPGKNDSISRIVIGIAVPIVAFVILLPVLVCFFKRRRKQKNVNGRIQGESSFFTSL